MLNPDKLAWKKMDGLIPAIVQDARDGRVLMQAFMNREALDSTIENGLLTFWSRSRKRLWSKGETSGNHLELIAIHPDCDGDCLLIQARPKGPVCHLGTETCFDKNRPASTELGFLYELESLIDGRYKEMPESSYTTALFEAGIRRIAQKVGEEGVETALAGTAGDDKELLEEAADLVFHLLVLLRARESSLASLVEVLKNRHTS